ncbi:conserved hypothetical protein [Culex quinquefasciatus]|uniref:C2H2-type domain-containing protein n=1 Tax=Culex quinquefasciatus TaxID=7176 RepID=B0W0R9_CULQU|nr:conserved hypothetical protein [Culex quinquefasciatus]|eukprot:XP_001842303.1 conserved hypothetical protein [Culex quinquefasciatus]
MEELNSMRNLELDKICRICLAMKREMRPLFGEMIEQLDGWPDKICIQCIHQVSRCHAFKTRVEKSDTTLRQYIKGITVVVEDHHAPSHHEMQRTATIAQQQPQPPKIQQIQPIQEIHIQRADIPTMAEQTAPTMILTNAQLLNAGAQIINAGHLLTTAAGQQIIQAPQYHAAQIGQFIQGLPNTIQMIAHGAPHPTQILQIQRTADDRCEIVVQPEMQEQQYYDENNVISVNPVQSVPVMVAAPTIHQQIAQQALHHHHQQQQQQHHQQQQHQQHQQQQHHHHHHHPQEPEPEPEEEEHLQQDPQEEEESEESHMKEGPDSEECGDLDESIDNEEMVEEEMLEEIEGEVEEAEQEQEQEEEFYITDGESDDEEKKLADFMTQQTTQHDGRFICNLCRKEFSQEKWLQTHMSSHSNWLKATDKLPTCSICQREFKSKSILYRHRQTHFEKNFACTLCDKRFSSNYQLNIHVQRHKQPKDHKCQHCDKAFYNASDLKVHVNQHLGIKVIQIKKVSTTS